MIFCSLLLHLLLLCLFQQLHNFLHSILSFSGSFHLFIWKHLFGSYFLNDRSFTSTIFFLTTFLFARPILSYLMTYISCCSWNYIDIYISCCSWNISWCWWTSFTHATYISCFPGWWIFFPILSDSIPLTYHRTSYVFHVLVEFFFYVFIQSLVSVIELLLFSYDNCRYHYYYFLRNFLGYHLCY